MSILSTVLTALGSGTILTLITLLVKVSMDYSKTKAMSQKDREENEKTFCELKNDNKALEEKLETTRTQIDEKLDTLFEFRLFAKAELATVSTQLKALKESLDNHFANLNEKIDKIK